MKPTAIAPEVQDPPPRNGARRAPTNRIAAVPDLAEADAVDLLGGYGFDPDELGEAAGHDDANPSQPDDRDGRPDEQRDRIARLVDAAEAVRARALAGELTVLDPFNDPKAIAIPIEHTGNKGAASRLVLVRQGGKLADAKRNQRARWVNALSESGLILSHRTILSDILSFGSPQGEDAWASQKEIVKKAKASVPTIRRAVAAAEGAGYLRRLARVTEGGKVGTYMYVIGIPHDDGDADDEPDAPRPEPTPSAEPETEDPPTPQPVADDGRGRWVGRLTVAADAAGLRVREREHTDALGRAAALLATVQDPEDAELVLSGLCALMMRPNRLQVWSALLDALPDDPDDLVGLACVIEAHDLAAADDEVDLLPFDKATGYEWLPKIIPGLMRVSHNPDAYAEYAAEHELHHPSRLYAEDTIKDAAKGRLRGVFSDRAIRDGGRKARELEAGVRVVE